MIYNIIINYKRQRERNKYVTFYYMERLFIIILKCGDWGLGIGDWGLGIGEWAQSPMSKPETPSPNPQSPIPKFQYNNK